MPLREMVTAQPMAMMRWSLRLFGCETERARLHSILFVDPHGCVLGAGAYVPTLEWRPNFFEEGARLCVSLLPGDGLSDSEMEKNPEKKHADSTVFLYGTQNA